MIIILLLTAFNAFYAGRSYEQEHQLGDPSFKCVVAIAILGFIIMPVLWAFDIMDTRHRPPP